MGEWQAGETVIRSSAVFERGVYQGDGVYGLLEVPELSYYALWMLEVQLVCDTLGAAMSAMHILIIY